MITKSQFGGHDSFHLRTGWLKKAYTQVKEDSTVFKKKEATELFGVGRNMVNAIRHWAVSSTVLDVQNHKYFRSSFGDLIFSTDPYLEDTASLWLLHYHLVTNPQRCTLWNWAFNHLNQTNFDKSLFTSSIFDFLTKNETISAENSFKTIEGDFAAFIKTYCERNQAIDSGREDVLDSPFSTLELINTTGKGSYRFKIGPKKELPKEVIAYTIAKLIKKNSSRNTEGAQSINLDDLLYGACSPGRVFKLDPETLIHYIEEICTTDLLNQASYSTSAGIKQLMINDFETIDEDKFIKEYLEAK